MASHINGVQAKTKEHAPSALFTYCYAHQLNLVLYQSVKFIPECIAFFLTIEGLASFFSHSTKRAKLLVKSCKHTFQRLHQQDGVLTKN